jgi:hypothetical protein
MSQEISGWVASVTMSKRSSAEPHYSSVSIFYGLVPCKEDETDPTPGGTMFARKVAVLLKPNSLAEFNRLMQNEVLVWLRQQEGFQGLITLAVPDSREIATVSFWDRCENAQAYDSTGYPEVLKMLQGLLDGAPYVKTFEVVNSTFQNLGSARQLETRKPIHEDQCGAAHLSSL